MQIVNLHLLCKRRTHNTFKCLRFDGTPYVFTGYYPWRIGMQRGAIERFQPDGLNTSLKILPEYLKEAGYKTHLVGKWHLGYCHPNYLPNNRGFDTHFGQWNHVTDYYSR